MSLGKPFLWPLLCLAAAHAPAQGVSPSGPATSPFRGMRMQDARLLVQVHDDTWCELVSIDGMATADLLRRTRAIERRWWKRLTEDLPSVFVALGQPIGAAVDLVVRDTGTGEQRSLTAVPLTERNRERLLVANRAAGNGANPDPSGALAPPKAVVTHAEASADLARLRTLLDEHFAYRELRPVDLDGLLAGATAALPDDEVPVDALAAAVAGVLRAFGDGHSRLVDPPPPVGPFLPFLVQQVAGGMCAFRPDRSEFVDEHRPFVDAIDGVPIARWLVAAQARGTQGSTVMQARGAERGLRDLGLLRGDLGLPAAEEVVVALRGSSGLREHRLAVARRRPAYGAWPLQRTRLLPDRIGYLRLPSMDDDAAFLDGIDSAMREFRDTRGLVVDVRGNGGGSRDALRRLAPYLLPERGSPVVGNVAALLLAPGERAGDEALADRGLWPADWSGWTPAQRGAIATALRTFRPSWEPPAGRFSPWYCLVLDRSDNPRAFPYRAPVVVLVDRGCFSATDVFAAALGVLPQVTLVGEATSGGSGRARRHALPHSGIAVQLSSMASFQPDGTLFEGHGVQPDVAVEASPGDLIGAGDTVLARAIELLPRRGR